jgi:hypothetical protein
MNSSPKLKLRATDAEDLGVVASMLQDAVVAVAEMKYLPVERRFVFTANRFRWEDSKPEREASAEGTPVYERTLTGVSFENVSAVCQLGVDQRRRGQVLSLLTLEAKEGGIELVFSAGAGVRLETDGILCHVEDFGEPWPTQRRPAHPDDSDG